MKEFAVYTLLRVGLFIISWVVISAVWSLVVGHDYLWPFCIAALLSSFVSLKFLSPQRERFAARVQAGAARASARMEEIRSREDED